MSNSLIRLGTTFSQPAVPYIAPRAAYDYVQTVTQTMSKPNGTGWVIVPVTDLNGNVIGSKMVYAPNGVNANVGGGIVGGVGSILSGTGFVMGTISYTITVHVPAQLEQLASPALRIDTPAAGWSSYGNTIANMFGNGLATWSVPLGITGAVVGFTQVLWPVAGYAHIPNGLMFTGGFVYLLSTGALLGSYVASDVFTQQIYAGVVTYKKNGSTLTTEANLNSPTTLWLGAVLYGTGDSVNSPVVTQLNGATVSAQTAPFDVYGANTGKGARVNVQSGIFFLAGAPQTKVNVLTGEFAAYGSDHYGAAQINVLMAAPTVVSYAGTIAPHIPTTVYVNSDVPWVSANSSTGQLGEVNALTPEFTVYGGALGHAKVNVLMAPAFVDSYPLPARTGLMFDTSIVQHHHTASLILIAYMRDGAIVSSTMIQKSVLRGIMRDIARATGTMTPRQVLQAIMRSFCNVGSMQLNPATNVETWVYNLDDEVGSTQYTNYNFDSYAVINGRFYGSSPQGLFELTGDTDNGAAIQANVDFGLRDFGTDLRKTIEECYVGMSGEGNLFVKITVPSNDDTQPDQTYIYSTSSYSASLKQQRVRMGKGLKGNFIGLTLYNAAGDDFELASVEFRVIQLSRRIG